MHRGDEKHLINELKDMPVVVDDMDKDELYKIISSRLSEEKSLQRRRKILIPFIAAAAALFLLFSIPFVLNIRNDQTVSMNESFDSQSNTLMDEESSAAIEADLSESSEESFDNAEIMTRQDEAMDPWNESRVLEAIPQNSQMMSFAIYDEQLQFVIPITLITSENKEKPVSFNELDSILTSNNLDSSEAAEIKEIALENIEEASYMIYKKQYFVPVEQSDNTSINEAIDILKSGMAESGLEGTIPSTIDFQVDANNHDELTLDYVGSKSIDKSDFTVTMIESILLTAKSYNYKEVLFLNMPIENIGMYQLSDSIKVPVGVNPIYLQN